MKKILTFIFIHLILMYATLTVASVVRVHPSAKPHVHENIRAHTEQTHASTVERPRAANDAVYAKRNLHLAGKEHPVTGIPFDKHGYPNFSRVAKKNVNIKFSGDRAIDVKRANQKAGYSETPESFVWHHHQNGRTMQLVPEFIHSKTGHDGGFSNSRKR